MLVNDCTFNVIESSRINLVVGAHDAGTTPVSLQVQVLPSVFGQPGKPSIPIPSPAGPLWDVGVGDSRLIEIPPTGQGYDLSNGFGAVRITADDPNRLFVAYLALAEPVVAYPVSGQAFTGGQFRIPVLDAPKFVAQRVRLCVTSLLGANVTVRDMLNGTTLQTVNGLEPGFSFLFDKSIPNHTELELQSDSPVVLSAAVTRVIKVRIYPTRIG